MSPWKGKARDDGLGDGGAGGIVLPLNMLYTSTYEAIYTLPISVGTSSQTQAFSVQVDTGSSDLWIASTSCSSQACKQSGKRYDPSQAQQTGKPFEIDYVQGVVKGPIVWDSVTLGGYEVDGQALAAATEVDSEPLSPSFNGVLGLALPANSIIAGAIAPTSGSPDGAILASNIFGLSPSYTSPSYRFMSLTLARPDGGMSSVPSYLGIGRHPPTSVISDPSKVQYSSLSTTADSLPGSAPKFWQGRLNAITVYVDGVRKEVSVGTSATALVDSGMPVIYASQTIANGIYGALGIGPGSDGQYWVPCTTPLNMSITLDGRRDIAVHPLDLTFSGQSFSGSLSQPTTPSTPLTSSGSSVSSASSSNMCLGLIQAYDPSTNVQQIADVILGVPFMRSVYTVMAYDPPDAHGAFPNASAGTNQPIRPLLGLLGLVDPAVALEEFHQERVLNQALPSPPGSNNDNGGAGSSGNRANVAVQSGKKLSVGLEVLIGLIGFFALTFIAFGVWWLVQRRRRARERRDALARGMYSGMGGGDSDDEKDRAGLMQREAAFILARRSSLTSRYGPSEETLRAKKFEEYMQRPRSQRMVSDYSDDTVMTRIGQDDRKQEYTEMGYLSPPLDDANDDTLVDRPPLIAEYPPSPAHTRMSSTVTERDNDVAMPLLAHTRDDSHTERAPLGMRRASSRPSSRARVGSFGSSGGARPPVARTVSGPRPMSQRTGSVGSVRSVRSAQSALMPSTPPPAPPKTLAAGLPGNDSTTSGVGTSGHDTS